MKDILEAMRERHSVRRYLEKPIESEKARTLREAIDGINQESGLHIQLILNEPEAFSGFMARYGSFRGCSSYFAVVGQPGCDEAVGYYGEKLVLLSIPRQIEHRHRAN